MDSSLIENLIFKYLYEFMLFFSISYTIFRRKPALFPSTFYFLLLESSSISLFTCFIVCKTVTFYKQRSLSYIMNNLHFWAFSQYLKSKETFKFDPER